MVAAQVCRAETTETGKPRLIQMMDDSNTYYTFCNTERPTAKHLEAMVDTFARADVDVLTMCLHCRWQAYYDSKVVEVAGDLSPEAVQPWEWTHYWHWLTSLRRLIAQGDDPPQVIAARCHQRGMKFLASFRLNDQHNILPHEGQYGSFRRDHPEWVIARRAMDYGVPEVRQHILKVARELVERYDIDGLDLDFMRWPVYFKKEEVKANTPLMTEFVRQIRSILEEGSRKKKRRLLLSVRVPTRIGEGKVINAPEHSPELECLGIGLDVRRWIKEGLIDMVCPMNFFYTDWPTMIRNIGEWRALTEGTRCRLYPTIHTMAAKDYGAPYISAASQRGAAYSYYLQEAGGIALYNMMSFAPAGEVDRTGDNRPVYETEEAGWGTVRDMGDPTVLSTKTRRYHCYLGDLISIARGERKTVDFYLPEDPKGPGARGRLRFRAVNLTLDHRLEVDVNGTAVDPRTLAFERRGPTRKLRDGAPVLRYSNVVDLPLAGTAAAKGNNVLGVKLVEINPEIPTKNTIEVGRVEAVFEPR